MKRLICTAFLGLMMSVGAQAALVTFDFTNLAGAAGDPLNLSQGVSSMGVNYTANLNLDGSGTIITDINGLALLGTGSTFEINANESILFNAATATGVSGGTAVFNGFTSISFTEFETGDTATVAGNAISSNGAFALSNVNSFTAAGVTDAPAPQAGFQITQLVADFTVVPTAVGVPEPSSFAALLLIGGMAVNRRRRRK